MNEQTTNTAGAQDQSQMPSDAQLAASIITQSRFPHLHRTIEDVEAAEHETDRAKAEIARRHPLGKAGREGLPDQG